MGIDSVGLIACGETLYPGDNVGIVLFTGAYVPLDSDRQVHPHYHGGQSLTHNVYVVIDKDDWEKYLASMKQLYSKLAMKHYGKSLLSKARTWDEQDSDIQEELHEASYSFIDEFKDLAISQLRSMSKSFNRHASDVLEDIKKANAFYDSKPLSCDKPVTTVNSFRLSYSDRMRNVLSNDWNTIAGVSNYQEPWNK